MAFPISLNQADYEALIELARRGTINAAGQVNEAASHALDSFLRTIETKAGVTRYAIWVQWQEQDEPLPPGTNFPETWPPEKRFYLALTSRPIARADVDRMLSGRARQPTSVLVTRDPAARVGWTELDEFFK